MALFTAQIFHLCLGQRWSNTYTISASDIATANDAVTDVLVPALLSIYRSDIQITTARTSTPGSANDDFITNIINTVGEGSSGGTTILPLYNCVKVEISVDAFRRPSVKYFRPPLVEGDQENGQLVSGATSAVAAFFASLISDMTTNGTPLTNHLGDLWVDAVPQFAVQMRQLHRARKRTATP